MDVDIDKMSTDDENHQNEGELMEYEDTTMTHLEGDEDEAMMDDENEQGEEVEEEYEEMDAEHQEMDAIPAVAEVLATPTIGVAPETDMIPVDEGSHVDVSGTEITAGIDHTLQEEEKLPNMAAHGLVDTEVVSGPSGTSGAKTNDEGVAEGAQAMENEENTPNEIIEAEIREEEVAEGDDEEYYEDEEEEDIEEASADQESREGKPIEGQNQSEAPNGHAGVEKSAPIEEQAQADTEEEITEETLTTENLPPIILNLPKSGTRALFSVTDDDEAGKRETVWLEDQSHIADKSISEVLGAIKDEMRREGLPLAGELVITEKEMDLKMGEYDLNLKEITLLELLQLHQGCGLAIPVQLYISFETNNFVTRYKAIKKALETSEDVIPDHTDGDTLERRDAEEMEEDEGEHGEEENGGDEENEDGLDDETADNEREEDKLQTNEESAETALPVGDIQETTTKSEGSTADHEDERTEDHERGDNHQLEDDEPTANALQSVEIPRTDADADKQEDNAGDKQYGAVEEADQEHSEGHEIDAHEVDAEQGQAEEEEELEGEQPYEEGEEEHGDEEDGEDYVIHVDEEGNEYEEVVDRDEAEKQGEHELDGIQADADHSDRHDGGEADDEEQGQEDVSHEHPQDTANIERPSAIITNGQHADKAPGLSPHIEAEGSPDVEQGKAENSDTQRDNEVSTESSQAQTANMPFIEDQPAVVLVVTPKANSNELKIDQIPLDPPSTPLATDTFATDGDVLATPGVPETLNIPLPVVDILVTETVADDFISKRTEMDAGEALTPAINDTQLDLLQTGELADPSENGSLTSGIGDIIDSAATESLGTTSGFPLGSPPVSTYNDFSKISDVTVDTGTMTMDSTGGTAYPYSSTASPTNETFNLDPIPEDSIDTTSRHNKRSFPTASSDGSDTRLVKPRIDSDLSSLPETDTTRDT